MGLRDFVKHFNGRGPGVAGESQNELKNKEIKLQRWNWATKCKHLLNGLKKCHFDTLGRWEAQKNIDIARIVRSLDDKEKIHVHHDAKTVNSMYKDMDVKCQKYIFKFLNAPKVVFEEYKEAVESVMSDQEKAELLKALGQDPQSKTAKNKRQAANRLSHEERTLEENRRKKQKEDSRNEHTYPDRIMGSDTGVFNATGQITTSKANGVQYSKQTLDLEQDYNSFQNTNK